MEEIKPGQKHYAYLSHTGAIYKIHILAIVDENMVVFKWYGKHKQWWHYEVESKKSIQNMIERTFEVN